MKLIPVLILLFASYSSLWASAEDCASIDFSDAKPKTKYAFGANLFTFDEWVGEGIPNRMDVIDQNFLFLLSGGEFRATTSYHIVRNKGASKCDFIYGRFDASQTLTEGIFFHIEYSPSSRMLYLVPSQCAALEDSSSPMAMDLSWRYVNAAYRWSLENSTEDELLVKSLPESIKGNGLERSFVRIGVVVNNDYTYSFYNVFENEEEEKRGDLFLEKLKNKFKSEEIISEDFYK